MRQGVSITGLLVAFSAASFAWVAPSGGGVGAWGLIAPAAAAKPRIAVVGVSAEQLSAEVRAKIDAAIAGGLAASGADVVDSTTTARRVATKGLGGCETSTCRVAIAEVTGAGYLVRGSVESMGRSYTVHLEMIDGATGSVIGMREDRCEICTESEAYETASVTASALKAEVLKRPGAGAPASEDGKGAPRVLAAPQPVASAASASGTRDTTTILAPSPGPAPPSAEPAPRLRTASWIVLGVGALVVAAGGLDLVLDGRPACFESRCPRTFDTRTTGIALMGGGALVAIVGATLLVARF